MTNRTVYHHRSLHRGFIRLHQASRTADHFAETHLLLASRKVTLAARRPAVKSWRAMMFERGLRARLPAVWPEVQRVAQGKTTP